MAFKLKSLVALTLAGAAAASQAGSLEIFRAPGNYSFSGLSDNGASAVGAGSFNLYLPVDRSPIDIGGASHQGGYPFNPAISADGRFISGTALNSAGAHEAAIYDVATNSWTTLGNLGGPGVGAAVPSIRTASTSLNISADGSTVVGYSYLVSGSSQVNKATVFRDGKVINLGGTDSTSSTAVSVSRDGSVVIGKVGNAGGGIWHWNAATGSYGSMMTSSGINPLTGSSVTVTPGFVSPNGLWAASAGTAFGVNYGDPLRPRRITQAGIINATTGEAMAIPLDHIVDTAVGSTDRLLNAGIIVAGVSDTGVVIGSYIGCQGCDAPLSTVDAWIYNAATNTTQTFDSFLAANGIALTPTQHVYNLSAMSADATAISGYLFDTSINQTVGFIAHVNTVPEPGQWLTLALGLPLLGLLARRRSRGQ